MSKSDAERMGEKRIEFREWCEMVRKTGGYPPQIECVGDVIFNLLAEAFEEGEGGLRLNIGEAIEMTRTWERNTPKGYSGSVSPGNLREFLKCLVESIPEPAPEKLKKCPNCYGGAIPDTNGEPLPCPQCKGTGYIKIEPGKLKVGDEVWIKAKVVNFQNDGKVIVDVPDFPESFLIFSKENIHKRKEGE